MARQAMDAIAAFLGPKLPEWLRPSLDASCRDCAEAAERAVALRHDLAAATDVVRTLDDAARHARAERARAVADGDIATVERLDLHLGDIAGVRARYAAARDRLAAETERDRAVDRPAEAGVAANSEAATTTGVPVPAAPAAAPPSPEHGDGGDDPDQGGGHVELAQGRDPPNAEPSPPDMERRIARYRRDAHAELNAEGASTADIVEWKQRIVAEARAASGASEAARERSLGDLIREIRERTGREIVLGEKLVEGAKRAFVAAGRGDADEEIGDAFYVGAVGFGPRARVIAEMSREAAGALPEGVTPPDDPLLPNPAPIIKSTDPSRIEGALEREGFVQPEVESFDRKREVRRGISQLYRVAVRDGAGNFRVSGEAFERYVADTAQHIKPEHRGVFELTARAVRAGALSWNLAAARLVAYYAPESTGEAATDFILDLMPVVGTLKSAADAFALMELGREAAAFGAKDVAEHYFMQAIAAAGGAIPLGPAAGAVKRFIRGTDKHHLVPLYTGGWKQWETVELARQDHRLLHKLMNQFLREYDAGTGRSMAWSWINSGRKIRRKFEVDEIIQRLDAFHAALEGDPRWAGVTNEWKRVFPELPRRKWRRSDLKSPAPMPAGTTPTTSGRALPA